MTKNVFGGDVAVTVTFALLLVAPNGPEKPACDTENVAWQFTVKGLGVATTAPKMGPGGE